MIGVKIVEVARLHKEVRLLAEGLPQLFDHALEVHELIGFHKLRGMTDNRAHDVDILSHNLLRAGSLYLDGNILARCQARAMHLGKRCATQRVRVDRIKNSAELLTILSLKAL